MAKSEEAFRTIGEVADWLNTPSHVLRFWESKFKEIKPIKGAGGRRYYRPADMLLIGGIKKLLHEEGMTIKSVKAYLRENGNDKVAAHSRPLDFTEKRQLGETKTKQVRKVDQMETSASTSLNIEPKLSCTMEQHDMSGESDQDTGTAIPTVDKKVKNQGNDTFLNSINDPDDDVQTNSGVLTFLANLPRCLTPDQIGKLRSILTRVEKTR